jgi:hypothetical protein
MFGLFCFVPQSPSPNDLIKMRYTNLGKEIKLIVEDMREIQPGTASILLRSLVHSGILKGDI